MNKNLVSLIVGWAIIIAPGCRQRTERSQVASLPVVSSEKVDSFVGEMGLHKQKRSLFEGLRNNVDDFYFYAADDQGNITLLHSNEFKNFDITSPIKNERTGQVYKNYFIQKRKRDEHIVLGVSNNLNSESNVFRSVLSEIVLRGSGAHGYNLTKYNTRELSRFVRSRTPLTLDLSANDLRKVQADFDRQARSYKSFMAKFSYNMQPSDQKEGIRVMSIAERVTVFAGFAVVVLICVLLQEIFDLKILGKYPFSGFRQFFGHQWVKGDGKMFAAAFVVCLVIAIVGYIYSVRNEEKPFSGALFKSIVI